MPQHYLPYLAPLIVAVIILRRAGRAQKISTTRIWIRPALFWLITAGGLIAEPFPGLIAISVYVAGALAGVGLGYLRARHQTISIHPETGELSSQATLIGTLLFLAVFGVRYGVKLAFPEMAHPGHGGAQVVMITNGLMIFTAAMFTAQAVLTWSHTRMLLATHAARLTAPPTE